MISILENSKNRKKNVKKYLRKVNNILYAWKNILTPITFKPDVGRPAFG